MTDVVRTLRWLGVGAVLLFGVLPAVMLSLLVAGGHTPRSVGLLLVPGIALVVCALICAARGILSPDPEASAQLMRRGMAFVAGADLIMLGGNALIGMVTG
ncbi:hypothetical protein GCM10010168_26360 [Actinoplanes ianthinogenes]|uniref:Uncharacterized protein n=1 Tax=Actinoplanes ianthinogenes TaxID=122358 RepID=A0ABM7M9D5_9ACTN|nr:hypothetical protein [Actinoplanes ianthinogenes]BCJ48276.1 hypothetical protein Aiant_89330 [Actinoplanes ianthinogenes]GGR07628.1 hypothetical protein GCM10010168_26360 [Actinoplanes ianthinogenes]